MVGSIFNADDLADIETVAKVFIVEQRMKNLTFELESNKIITVPPFTPVKKSDIFQNNYSKRLPLMNVRGFN